MLQLTRLLATIAAALFALPAVAENYPARPIRLYVAFPPGGAADIVARLVAQPLSDRLGQPVVVENKPGSGGNIVGELIARAAPDGYSLLIGPDNLFTINPHLFNKMSFDPRKDIVPIATIQTNQLVLAINPKVPAQNFKDFVALAERADPPLFYASIGNGSQHHLAMEMLKQRSGMDLTHVPYKGGGPASISVIAGENAVMFGGTSVVQHITSGKLKPLAVSGKKGWATLPNVAGIDELYPGYSVVLWHGIFAPKNTPQPILDKLRAEINAVLAMPKVKEQLITSGAGEPYVTTPQEFSALLHADYDAYGKVIKELGFKVD
jgi:tripartite-type tricarboxylate transporter receptor subunit TctC